jgi:hypothetical protein
MGFERRQSLLRGTVTTEGQVKGNQIVFDVVSSGGAQAQTRGVNGLIPARAEVQVQNTCTLTEWHDLVRKTNFNIESSQGGASGQRASMQMDSMGVINRKIDSQIITALSGATQYAGTTATSLTLDKAAWAINVVLNGDVPLDNNISGLLTPAAYMYLLQIKEVTSDDYVGDRKLENMPVRFRWAGINWIVHTGLPGANTSSETLMVYHKAAIGHGMNMDLQVDAGYDGEQNYSWARTTVFSGAKLMQNGGVCLIRHDGSGYTATA